MNAPIIRDSDNIKAPDLDSLVLKIAKDCGLSKEEIVWMWKCHLPNYCPHCGKPILCKECK